MIVLEALANFIQSALFGLSSASKRHTLWVSRNQRLHTSPMYSWQHFTLHTLFARCQHPLWMDSKTHTPSLVCSENTHTPLDLQAPTHIHLDDDGTHTHHNAGWRLPTHTTLSGELHIHTVHPLHTFCWFLFYSKISALVAISPCVGCPAFALLMASFDCSLATLLQHAGSPQPSFHTHINRLFSGRLIHLNFSDGFSRRRTYTTSTSS